MPPVPPVTSTVPSGSGRGGQRRRRAPAAARAGARAARRGVPRVAARHRRRSGRTQPGRVHVVDVDQDEPARVLRLGGADQTPEVAPPAGVTSSTVAGGDRRGSSTRTSRDTPTARRRATAGAGQARPVAAGHRPNPAVGCTPAASTTSRCRPPASRAAVSVARSGWVSAREADGVVRAEHHRPRRRPRPPGGAAPARQSTPVQCSCRPVRPRRRAGRPRSPAAPARRPGRRAPPASARVRATSSGPAGVSRDPQRGRAGGVQRYPGPGERHGRRVGLSPSAEAEGVQRGVEAAPGAGRTGGVEQRPRGARPRRTPRRRAARRPAGPGRRAVVVAGVGQRGVEAVQVDRGRRRPAARRRRRRGRAVVAAGASRPVACRVHAASPPSAGRSRR